jgi:multidrug efflux pump subunit AcrB
MHSAKCASRPERRSLPLSQLARLEFERRRQIQRFDRERSVTINSESTPA